MIQRQQRTIAGFGLIAAGVVVAILGYVGVSSETEVAFQLPYFASAGVGALLLMGGGAVLLVNGQLERDTDRLDEMEAAVRQLAGEVGRLADAIEEPAEHLRAVGEDDEVPPPRRRTRARKN